MREVLTLCDFGFWFTSLVQVPIDASLIRTVLVGVVCVSMCTCMLISDSY